MAVGKRPGGTFFVMVYDPAVRRKVYMGSYGTEAEARAVEDACRKGLDKSTLRRCPGCRKLFRPDDEWQKRCSLRCEQNVKRRQRRRAERRTDDHWVYTALGADCEVVYVGVTSTGLRRHREHGRDMAWWPEVVWLKVDHYATREEALAAESVAIAKHQPRFNTLGVESEAA